MAAQGYLVRLTDAEYMRWACSWTPSWEGEEAWASTSHILEADIFPSVQAAKEFIQKHGLRGEVWRLELEPVKEG